MGIMDVITLAQSARYHGKVGALTLLSGTLAIHGNSAAKAIGEGAIDGVRNWAIQVLGPEAAYDLLQQAADLIANDLVAKERTQG